MVLVKTASTNTIYEVSLKLSSWENEYKGLHSILICCWSVCKAGIYDSYVDSKKDCGGTVTRVFVAVKTKVKMKDEVCPSRAIKLSFHPRLQPS